VDIVAVSTIHPFGVPHSGLDMASYGTGASGMNGGGGSSAAAASGSGTMPSNATDIDWSFLYDPLPWANRPSTIIGISSSVMVGPILMAVSKPQSLTDLKYHRPYLQSALH